MNIGLFGYGVVGKGAYEIIKDLDGFQVTKICCLNREDNDDVIWLDKPDEILNDNSIDVVIELIGGYHPAYEFTKNALEAGKSVITANKALICKYYDELTSLAIKNNVCYRFSAAVGGGIAWLHELERVKKIQNITEIQGIYNGTSNFILDNMTKSGANFDDALKEAQKLGYAEADPSADIDGVDAWNKIVISSNFAFNTSVDRDGVPAIGVRNINAKDISNFTEHDYTCKLIGIAKQKNNEYSAFVQPCLLPSNNLFAHISDNYNLITYVGDVSGKMSFYGQGAGRYPTAGNVVLDLLDVNKGNNLVTQVYNKVTVNNSNAKYKYYVSDSWTGKTTENWGNSIITDYISIDEIFEFTKANTDVFVAAIIE